MSEELNVGSPQPQETQTNDVTTPEVNTTPTETVTEQPKIKVKYNHEEKELSYDDAVTYAQKGMNYDKTLERNQQLEKDYQIARQYGAEYGVYSVQDIIDQYGNQGIKSFEDFEKAVERQKYIDKGIDPAVLDEAINNNPIVKEASTLLEQQRQQQYLADQVKSLEAYSPGIDVSNLDPRVIAEFQSGKPLVDAYVKYENEILKTKLAEYEGKFKAQETNQINAASSTGSLTGNGSNINDHISFETFEANKHDQKWIIKNLSKINESRAKW